MQCELVPCIDIKLALQMYGKLGNLKVCCSLDTKPDIQTFDRRSGFSDPSADLSLRTV